MYGVRGLAVGYYQYLPTRVQCKHTAYVVHQLDECINSEIDADFIYLFPSFPKFLLHSPTLLGQVKHSAQDAKMVTSLEDVQSSLKSFLGGHPEIKYIPRTSPDFSSVGAIFNRRYNSAPLAIVRPQTAEHVAALVSYCVANAVKFTIRSGGHSLTGQSKEQDALMIDMRDINYTRVNESRTSVAVGGGILQAKLIKDLSGQGLVTPTGSIKTVGYAGWGIYGGYGPLAGHYGLGLDNIIGAKIVNAKGQVVTADSELLRGIRGGGGTFGVIVELTAKVYPLKQASSFVVVDRKSETNNPADPRWHDCSGGARFPFGV